MEQLAELPLPTTDDLSPTSMGRFYEYMRQYFNPEQKAGAPAQTAATAATPAAGAPSATESQAVETSEHSGEK